MTTTATATPEATLSTYRALRVGMVAVTLLLLVAVALEIVRAGAIPASISATFHSPVRSVLVGVMIAVALALVAIKGRRGWEDGLLTVAGLLVPLVGLIPTPAATSSTPGPELALDVGNNVAAYLIVGGLGLVLAWARRLQRPTVVAATALWLAVGGWFVLGRDSFLTYAHNVSAVAFFALLVAVVSINGRRTAPPYRRHRMTREAYRRSYYAIAVAMAAAVVVGLLAFVVTGQQSAFPLIFWLEVVLLLLYITFWVLQTVEHWDQTAPEPA